jgi:hypothetical protein
MIVYKTVDIRRSELAIIHKDVAAWELPILEAMHDSVAVSGDKLVRRAVPTAIAEFQRLTALYKDSTNPNGDKGIPFVESVYGQGRIGMQNLQRAIDDAVVEDEPEAVEVEDLL